MNNDPMFTEETEAQAIEESPAPQNKGFGFIETAFDVVEMFAWSVLVVLIVFSFAFRLCRVDGRSMENTLYNEQNLILFSLFYEPKQDDIIVFHLTDPESGLEKTLVKRVIATEGQEIVIDFKAATITIDGKEYADEHSVLKSYTNQIIDIYTLTAEHHFDRESGVFSATVPDGHVFVMGDNRNHSKDSRDSDIGFVDERCILGKAMLRVSPFTVFS